MVMESIGITYVWYKAVLRVVYISRCLPRFVFYTIQNFICPPMFCVWFFLCLPIKFINKRFFYWMFGKLFDAYLIIVCSWLDTAGHSVYECGDDISNIAYDETLLIVNHQSPTDIGTMMRALQEKNFVFSRVVWVMDWLIQFVHFGWVSKLHGDFFLLQTNDAKRLAKLYSFDIQKSNQLQPVKLHQNIKYNFFQRGKKWIILFPEGGFLRNRIKGSHRYAERNGLPLLQNVTLPRSKAVHTIFNTLDVSPTTDNSTSKGRQLDLNEKSHHLKWIVDVTIGYNRPIGVMEYILGATGPRQVVVHHKRLPASDVFGSNHFTTDDEKEESIRTWLNQRYILKEEMLSYFYKYNNFPAFECSDADASLRYPKLDYVVLLFIQVASFSTFYILMLVYSRFCS